MGQTIRH